MVFMEHVKFNFAIITIYNFEKSLLHSLDCLGFFARENSTPNMADIGCVRKGLTWPKKGIYVS